MAVAIYLEYYDCLCDGSAQCPDLQSSNKMLCFFPYDLLWYFVDLFLRNPLYPRSRQAIGLAPRTRAEGVVGHLISLGLRRRKSKFPRGCSFNSAAGNGHSIYVYVSISCYKLSISIPFYHIPMPAQHCHFTRQASSKTNTANAPLIIVK